MHFIIIACPHPLSILLCCAANKYSPLIPCVAVYVSLFFLLYRKSRMPYYVSIKAYNSTVQEGVLRCSIKALWACRYARWRVGILRKETVDPENRVDQHRTLESLQRRATKFILNDFHSSYRHRLTELHLLPLMAHIVRPRSTYPVNQRKQYFP